MRECVRVVSEEDKLRASTLEQSHSQGQTMELRGVCVLLGVLLLLVDCSAQQSQPRRKPARKGTTAIWETHQGVACVNFSFKQMYIGASLCLYYGDRLVVFHSTSSYY